MNIKNKATSAHGGGESSSESNGFEETVLTCGADGIAKIWKLRLVGPWRLRFWSSLASYFVWGFIVYLLNSLRCSSGRRGDPEPKADSSPARPHLFYLGLRGSSYCIFACLSLTNSCLPWVVFRGVLSHEVLFVH